MPFGAKGSGASHASTSPSTRGGFNGRRGQRSGVPTRGTSYSHRGNRDESEAFSNKRQRTQSFEGARAGKKSKEVKNELVKSIGRSEVKSRSVNTKPKKFT